MHDLIIVGAGPAGITAGIYAARKKMTFLILSDGVGGQAALSADIENYTGYQFITGVELVNKFEEHLKQFKFDFRTDEPVLKIRKIEPFGFVVETKRGSYESKSVIVASGRRPRLLNIKGEEALKNKGVSYCATCDGPIFTKKVVAVIGGGNSALDAALQMSKIASSVYLINLNPSLDGDEIMIEKVEKDTRIAILNQTKTEEILGDKFVSGIRIRQGSVSKELQVQGIFVEIGSVPNSGIIDFVDKNGSGEIIVDNLNRTNVSGVFAAGDVTNVPEKQIIVAAGEGAKAVLGVFRYLAQTRN